MLSDDTFTGGDGTDRVDYSGEPDGVTVTLDGIANDGPATDHDNVDYGLVAANARLIIDTRNVMARTGLTNARVVKA